MWNETGKKQENEALITALPKVNTCRKVVRTPAFPASWGYNQSKVNISEKNTSP